LKLINVVFEYEYDDVDILSVPDYIAENIDNVVANFCTWQRDPKNAERFLVPYENRMVLSIGTEEFLWWINHYAISDLATAAIVKQHTHFCPAYPSAHF